MPASCILGDATRITASRLNDLRGLICKRQTWLRYPHPPNPFFFFFLPRIPENICLCERSSHAASAKSTTSRLKLCIVKMVDNGLAVMVGGGGGVLSRETDFTTFSRA